MLADLIAGKRAPLPDVDGAPVVQLAPGVAVPPILVGGTADAALRRVVRHGDGWFAMPVPPEVAAPYVGRLRQFAADAGRPAPSVTGSIIRSRSTVIRRCPRTVRSSEGLSDPDGVYGMPPDVIDSVLVTGGADEVGERIAGWAALGADRVVFTLAAGDWHRQAELLRGSGLPLTVHDGDERTAR